MMVERYPVVKEEVGGSIPICEISSLLDMKLVKWLIASCVLASACQPYVSKLKLIKKKKNVVLKWCMILNGVLAYKYIIECECTYLKKKKKLQKNHWQFDSWL
jgi:hypothetical protein